MKKNSLKSKGRKNSKIQPKSFLVLAFLFLYISLFCAQAMSGIVDFDYKAVVTGEVVDDFPSWIISDFDYSAMTEPVEQVVASAPAVKRNFENEDFLNDGVKQEINKNALNIDNIDFENLYGRLASISQFASKFSNQENTDYQRESAGNSASGSFSQDNNEANFFSAVEVRKTSEQDGSENTRSGWVGVTATVPEPLSGLLYIFGAFALVKLGRVRRNSFLFRKS